MHKRIWKILNLFFCIAHWVNNSTFGTRDLFILMHKRIWKILNLFFHFS